jgi:membrane protein YqaA with SNARE-associated domain
LPEAQAKKPGPMKRLYNWVLHWAETPYAVPALFILAFAESSFFPIPPDALLIVLCLGMVHRSFHFAAYCAVASVLGGILGYYIGFGAYEWIGVKIIAFYGLEEKIVWLANRYTEVGVWALAVAGFTPVPYKLFTIATGMFDAVAAGAASGGALAGVAIENMKAMGLGKFILVSSISRSARFFLVAGLFYFFGKPVKKFIDKYLNILTIIFGVMLILGFVAVKYLF